MKTISFSHDSEKNHYTSFRAQLLPVLLLAAIFFLNFIARILLAPLMPTIENDLGMSHADAGTFFLWISSGYFISLTGAGFLSSRLTHRWTIILSTIAVGIVLFCISFNSTLWAIRLGFFALGLAAGAYLPSGIATITALISPRHWGRAIAIHELAPNLAFSVAPLIVEGLLPLISWREILALTGVASVVAGLAFTRFGKGGEFPGEAPDFTSLRILFAEPEFWILMILFSLAIGSTIGIYSMLPLYLVTERGFDQNWANTVVALSRMASLGFVFLAGWATDRLGTKQTMIGCFMLTGITTVLLGISKGDWVILFIFFQAMLAVCFFPAGFAALSRIGPPRTQNMNVSFTIPAAFFLGAGAIPAGIGVMGDVGSFSLGIVLAGVLVLVGTLLNFFLK